MRQKNETHRQAKACHQRRSATPLWRQRTCPAVWVAAAERPAGGDIDLYVEADTGAEETLERELKLYAALQRRLGEQQIDIVVHRADAPLRPIDIEARKTGIAL